MIQNQAFMKASRAFFQRTVKENGSTLYSHIFSPKSAVPKVGSINQTTLLNQFNRYQTRLINNNGKRTESRSSQGKQFFSMFSFTKKSRVNWNSFNGYHRSSFSPNTQRNFSYESEQSSRPPFSGVLKVWAATAAITGACGLLTLTKYEPLEKLKQEWDRNYQKRKRQALREETWYSYWYYTTTDTQKVQFALIALNAIVFGLWQRSGGYFMYRYFAHSAYDTRVLPAFLSFFSHQSIGHFAFNMIAFYSFSSSIGAVLGAEHILAMYLAGGMFSSAASHTFKFLVRDAAPSLGASGAVSAMILAHGYLFPQSIMSIIFLPFISFTAGKFIPVWLGIECAGVIAKVMGWFRSSFDHTAHLAGALFGYLYIQSWIEVQRARRRSIKRDFR